MVFLRLFLVVTFVFTAFGAANSRPSFGDDEIAAAIARTGARIHRETLRKAEAGDPAAQNRMGKNYHYGRGPFRKDEATAFRWWMKSAKQGYAEGQKSVSSAYLFGNGVKEDRSKWKYWLEKAAHGGLASAQESMGDHYSPDMLLPAKDASFAKAIVWYKRAASQGKFIAQYRLGVIYHQGDAGGKKPVDAFHWFKSASDKGYGPAMLMAGQMSASGTGTIQDFASAARYYSEALNQRSSTPYYSAQASSQAAYLLGMATLKGQGVTQDFGEGARLLARAGRGGVAAAKFYLAGLYADGRNIRQDPATAIKLYEEAFAAGIKDSAYYLGTLYERGAGIPTDYGKAAKWYRKAAADRISAAQARLGYLYHAGHGVSQDVTVAATWYEQAATGGDVSAQVELGRLYFSGHGVDKNFQIAAKWLGMAADQGVPYAQGHIGSMYANGQGVPQDFKQAFKWFSLAAAANNAGSVTDRDSVAKKMTPSQVAEAQEMVAKWTRSKSQK